MEDWHWQVVIVIAATYKGALAAISYSYGGIKTELYRIEVMHKAWHYASA